MSHEELIEDGWLSGKCQCVGRPNIYRKSNIKIKIYWTKREPDYVLLINKSQVAYGPVAGLRDALIKNKIITL